jgi:hypothetical protein
VAAESPLIWLAIVQKSAGVVGSSSPKIFLAQLRYLRIICKSAEKQWKRNKTGIEKHEGYYENKNQHLVKRRLSFPACLLCRF